MRINASDLAFASHNSLFQIQEKGESLKSWHKPKSPYLENAEHSTRSDKPLYTKLEPQRVLNRPDRVTLSDEALDKRAEATSIANQATQQSSALENPAEQTFDAKKDMLRQLVESLTGRKVSVLNVEELEIETESSTERITSESLEQVSNGRSRNIGASYDYHEEIHSKETFDFEAKGTIVTSDGQSFEFDLDLEMTREFHSETDISIDVATGRGRCKEPVTLNYAGLASDLTDFTFEFDLDLEQISPDKAAPGKHGRGHLAVDKGKFLSDRETDDLTVPAGSIKSGSDPLDTIDGEIVEYPKQESTDWAESGYMAYDKFQVLSFQYKQSYQMQTFSAVSLEAAYAKNMKAVPENNPEGVSIKLEDPKLAAATKPTLPPQLPQIPKPLAQGLI